MRGYELEVKETIESKKHTIVEPYSTLDKGIEAFIKTSIDYEHDTYSVGSTLDLDRRINRLKQINLALLRFKLGELKSARFELRETIIILRKAKP